MGGLFCHLSELCGVLRDDARSEAKTYNIFRFGTCSSTFQVGISCFAPHVYVVFCDLVSPLELLYNCSLLLSSFTQSPQRSPLESIFGQDTKRVTFGWLLQHIWSIVGAISDDAGCNLNTHSLGMPSTCWASLGIPQISLR